MTDCLEYEDVAPLVEAALAEDVGSGDITTEPLFTEEALCGRFVSREDGVLCGIDLVGEVVARHAPHALLVKTLADGDPLTGGVVIAGLSGPARQILPLERLLLNFMQRLCGIATTAKRYVDAVKGTAARIYDTRKTTPGWRKLEKYAVRTGGACNHREGLFDAVLVKDNHIAIARRVGLTLAQVVDRIRTTVGKDIFLEVEVDTLADLAEVAQLDVDAVLLDNMDVATLKEAVAMVRSAGRGIEVEASGGITLSNVAEIARTGVDRISIGALTHSPQSLDISFECQCDDA